MLAGDVIEMATGEGKTLAGAIAAAGYALAGRHVHVVTINDYLARRDAEWMGPLLDAMGLTVGWITADSTLTSAGPHMTVMSPMPRSTRLASMYCAISW